MASVKIVVVFGLPGSGKSYFAKRLAEAMGGTYINSDRLRKELFAKPSYTQAEKARVYEGMIQRMWDAVGQKEPVVLDATFHTRESRERIPVGAENEVRFIEVRAEESIIEGRLKNDRPYSDADFGVYQLIKKEWEAMEERHLTLESTNDNIDMMLITAIQYLKNDTETN